VEAICKTILGEDGKLSLFFRISLRQHAKTELVFSSYWRRFLWYKSVWPENCVL